SFHQRVYALARRIPSGATLTYGEVATRIGSPGAARAVGQALGRNPFAIVVPCHRVLAAGGKLGGFTADGGVSTKLKMLTLEGARAPRVRPQAGAKPEDAPPLFDGDGAFGFDPLVAVEHLRTADDKLARVI